VQFAQYRHLADGNIPDELAHRARATKMPDPAHVSLDLISETSWRRKGPASQQLEKCLSTS